MASPTSDTISISSERTVNGQQPQATMPKVNALCRRIHGWSWQAVSACLLLSGLIDSESLVPGGHGYWSCLCRPLRPQGQVTSHRNHRNLFLFPEHGPVPPQLDDAFVTSNPFVCLLLLLRRIPDMLVQSIPVRLTDC